MQADAEAGAGALLAAAARMIRSRPAALCAAGEPIARAPASRQRDPMTDPSLPPADDPTLPVSARIRARIRQAGQRFHANDNIADHLRPGEIDALLDEVEGKMKGVLESLVIDTDSDHNTQDTARRVAKMYLTEVFRGRYVAGAAGDRVPQRRAPERADDRRPDHGAQRLQPPLLPDPRPALDRRDAQRALEPDRPVEVLAPRRVDHGPAADPGGGDRADGRPADAQGQPRRPRGGDGSGPLLHALARRQGRPDQDGQQRDARLVPEELARCAANSCP